MWSQVDFVGPQAGLVRYELACMWTELAILRPKSVTVGPKLTFVRLQSASGKLKSASVCLAVAFVRLNNLCEARVGFGEAQDSLGKTPDDLPVA